MTEMRRKPQKVRTSPFRFAVGLFALTLITQLFHGFNLSYYVDGGLVSMYLASVCKIIFVIVDGVNDLLFGALSEKTRSRWGKRLPWLVGGMPFLAAFILLAYAVNVNTPFSPLGFFFYYLIISIMIENASTVMYINYGALYPVLFVTEDERTRCSGYRHLLEVAAMGLCYVCTPWLFGQIHSYFLIGLIYTVIYLAAMWFCISGLRIKGKEDVKLAKPYSFVQTLRDVWRNKPFLIYHLAQSFFQAILALLVTIYPMYCKYVIKAEGWRLSILMGVLFGSLVISVPIWFKIIKKYGFRLCWKICFTVLPLGLFLLTFPTAYWHALIILPIIGPFVAGLMLTPDMMSAELIDIDKMNNHVSREASFNSIGSLISRFSLILSAIVMAALSFAFGYESGANPGPNPELAFRALCGVMLPLVAILGTFFSYVYIRMSKQDSDRLKLVQNRGEEN